MSVVNVDEVSIFYCVDEVAICVLISVDDVTILAYLLLILVLMKLSTADLSVDVTIFC